MDSSYSDPSRCPLCTEDPSRITNPDLFCRYLVVNPKVLTRDFKGYSKENVPRSDEIVLCCCSVSEAIKAALADGKDSFSIIGPDRRLMVFDITPDVKVKLREDDQQVPGRGAGGKKKNKKNKKNGRA